MTVFSRQDAGPTWLADGVPAKTSGEDGSLVGQAVNVRCLDQCRFTGIGTDGFQGMVVTENEEDIFISELEK